MQSRIRFHVQERLRRLYYIKWELHQKVYKALEGNKYVSYKISTTANLISQQSFQKKYTLSRHRIVCPLNSSFKIVSKKYRLSRFSLNSLARSNNISGLLRRGW